MWLWLLVVGGCDPVEQVNISPHHLGFWLSSWNWQVREGIVRMMEEKREKQHLAKVLSELREAHKELEEEVKVLREENKRLKEAVLVVDGRRRGRRREEERSSPDGQEREGVDEEGLIGPSVHNGKRLLQEVYRCFLLLFFLGGGEESKCNSP